MSDGQEATLVAENTFTASQGLRPGGRCSVGLVGTWDAVATLQRRFQKSDKTFTAWFDVDGGSWSGNVQTTYVGDEGCEVRLGIKTGDFVSGDMEARIGFG